MESNYLSHYGVRGQKWGVRRYQNKDGSLTNAGRKRYNKEMENIKSERKVVANKKRTQKQLNKLKTEKEKLEAEKKELDQLKKGKKDSEEPKPQTKTKTVKDMTDRELEDAIYRTQLEQRYNALHPEQVSAGKQFIKKYGPKLAERAWNDIGKKVVTDAIEKKLGLKSEDTSAALEKAAKDMKNKRIIAEGEDWFKKRAEKQRNSSKSSDQDSKGKSEKTETYTGTVEGKGTSRRTNRDDGPIFDADYREVNNSSYTDTGRKYIESNPFLLEDRRGR